MDGLKCNLVDYSSSDSESDGSNSPSINSSSNLASEILKSNRKRRASTDLPECKVAKSTPFNEENRNYHLPSPASLFGLSVSPVEHEDDPSAHMGRIRSFAHERGNWAGYVCIPCDVLSEMPEMIQSLINRLKSSAQFHPVTDLHISLSRTIVLLHHWILPFVQDLKKNLLSCQRGSIRLCSLELYCNEEQTRTFLGLTVVAGRNLLESYVAVINKSLKEYRLPEYYEHPKFHVSVAWALGDVRHEVDEALLTSLQDCVDEWFADSDDVRCIEVRHLRLKTGNKTFILELPPAEIKSTYLGQATCH